MHTHKSALIILFCCLVTGIQGSVPAQSPQQISSPWLFTPSGVPVSASRFPIAVWLQDPGNAARYKAAGFNLYIGLWQGPTEEQLAVLKAAGMPVICERNAVGIAHLQDPLIAGWMHQDEPDNAQPVTDPKTGQQGYGPCIPPEQIVSQYRAMKARDPSRPILLNLGQGVANDEWVGRGSGAKLDDYRTYVNGGDIVSFDVYPVAGLDKDGENRLWYVPKGVDRLKGWTESKKPIWNCIECTRISGPNKATPHQVRAEVWMALIHGSKGLVYFVHQFQPKFDEHALLDDPAMLVEVTATNRQIQELATVLNGPASKERLSVTSDSPDVPVDVLLKRQVNRLYLFTVGMRNAPTQCTFRVLGLPHTATAEVLGENRTISLRDGQFRDRFQPYDVHLYRIRL